MKHTNTIKCIDTFVQKHTILKIERNTREKGCVYDIDSMIHKE